ncbi:MAG: hypothetical protein K0V04_18250 [Deltaproteobacteria bacterium]|nr:hypothetical protein [Deltaproteobacteria bacterium]
MRLQLVLASTLLLVPSCGDDSGSGDVGSTESAPTTTANPSGTGVASNGTSTPSTGGTPNTGSSAGPDDSTGADATTDETSDPDSSSGTMDSVPPVNSAELLPWLEAGEYTAWPSESGIHDSDGPHFGDVWTFVNNTMLDSLTAGNAEHPMGAAAVKELYGMGNEVRGWSVSVKLAADSSGGDNWYWYEVYDGQVFGDGDGISLCTDCHSMGSDYFRSPFPLQ